jgi:phosphate:Na+ symporter
MEGVCMPAIALLLFIVLCPALALADAAEPPAPVKMGVGVLAGLAIFFFGVYEMTQGLRAAAEQRLRKVLARFTQNRFTGVLTGTIATAIVDSSSLVTIISVGLVSAGLISFYQALGVVLGANVGTTLSSQIIALGLTDYFGLVLALGAGLRFLSKRERTQQWGRAVMGLGFVFFGLEEIESSLAPLKDSETFLSAMKHLESPLYGILIGAAITAVIQSSSATMGVVIVLAGQGAMSLEAGIAVMMGAELGTCVDTMASTIGQSREAVRTGVFHLLFNVFNVALLGWFTGPLAELAVRLTGGEGPAAIARQIANAHVAFNVLGVLAVLPFLQTIARALERLIPTAKAGVQAAPELATG